MDRKTRQEVLRRARAWLDENGQSGASLARELGKSPSGVNRILRGDWPHRGGWAWPRYLDRWLARRGLHPDGAYGPYVLTDGAGEVLTNGAGDPYQIRDTRAGAARRNERFEADGKTVRWVERTTEVDDPLAHPGF